MAVSLVLRPEQIARAECILADGLESIQSVKKRTGADILFNWPIYDFDGGTIRSRFCLFGSRFGDYPSWGIAFGADGKPFWDYDGESGAPCFAGAYSYLVRDGRLSLQSWQPGNCQTSSARTACPPTAWRTSPPTGVPPWG